MEEQACRIIRSYPGRNGSARARRFSWVSSFGSDVNYDYGVSFAEDDLAKGDISYNYAEIAAADANDELPGLSTFAKDGAGAVFHTYSTYAPSLEELVGSLMILDRAGGTPSTGEPE